VKNFFLLVNLFYSGKAVMPKPFINFYCGSDIHQIRKEFHKISCFAREITSLTHYAIIENEDAACVSGWMHQ
jgi:hypothetical protein